MLAGLGVSAIEIPPEWGSVQACDTFDVLRTGVGKANASGAVALHLKPGVHAAVISVGIAGALPKGEAAGASLEIGQSIAADEIVMADEGVRGPGGFQNMASLGFPAMPVPNGVSAVVPAHVRDWLTKAAHGVGPIATVSVCSGTDELARDVALRTGARAEAMEGAGVALAALRLGVPFGEVRVISNTTGNRDRQVWKLSAALEGLTALMQQLKATARPAFSDCPR